MERTEPECSRPCSRTVFFLLAVILSFTSVSGTFAAQLPADEMVQFVDTHLPRLAGQVIEVRERVAFVRLRQGKPPLPVQIIRENVRETEQGFQTVQQTIGFSSLQPARNGLARMRLSTRLSDRIQKGDMVSNAPIRLFVTGSFGGSFSDLSRRLMALPDIQDVRKGSPEGPTSTQVLELILSIGPSDLELRKREEVGTIARMTLTDSQSRDEMPAPRPSRETQTNFRIRSLQELDRAVQSFDWVSLGNRQSIQITALGTKGALGFARWDESEEELRGVRWHTLNKQPDILQVSLFPSPRGERQVIYALIVTRPDKQRTILSRLMRFDPTTNSLEELWTARNLWMTLMNGQVYGQEIGREDPLSNPPRPVTITQTGWEWSRDTPAPSIPRQTAPGGFRLSSGQVYRINQTGYLEVYESGRRLIRSSEPYGASPLTVGQAKNPTKGEARRARPIPPGMVIQNSTNGQVQVVIAKNHEEGFLVEAAKSYPNSTLFVLSRRPRRFIPVWESSKLPGFISQIRRGPGGVWAAVVVQQTGGDFLTSFLGGKTSHTVFYRLRGPSGWNQP